MAADLQSVIILKASGREPWQCVTLRQTCNCPSWSAAEWTRRLFCSRSNLSDRLRCIMHTSSALFVLFFLNHGQLLFYFFCACAMMVQLSDAHVTRACSSLNALIYLLIYLFHFPSSDYVGSERTPVRLVLRHPRCVSSSKRPYVSGPPREFIRASSPVTAAR